MSDEKNLRSRSDNYGQILGLRGLRLPAIALKGLQTAGIYCQAAVSIEHQHLAHRYVLRGVESGGAVADLGAYCGFVDDDGHALAWLQRVDSIAVNGVHGIVISACFTRLQMLRVQRTYDLLITRHFLEGTGDGRRPRLGGSILFYGRRGTLEMDLTKKDAGFRGGVAPAFYSRSGELATPPSQFEEAVLRVTAAASCVGCRHCHLLHPPAVLNEKSTSPTEQPLS